jgi:opacity protein-like surface antigen
MTTRFMSRASAAFLSFVAAAASGQAQAQTYDGSGALRFGAFVQASDFDFEVERPSIAAGFTFDSDTFYGGGVSIGYDWGSRKTLILGVEADASIDDSDAEYLLTFRGRLGTHLQPGWLVYATGGVALLSVEAPDRSTVAGVQVSDPSDTLTGWTVGGGTELDLQRFTLFAEYLFADFDTLDFKVHGLVGPGIVTPVNIDVDEQVFRVGVKFKLGHDDSPRKGLK